TPVEKSRTVCRSSTSRAIPRRTEGRRSTVCGRGGSRSPRAPPVARCTTSIRNPTVATSTTAHWTSCIDSRGWTGHDGFPAVVPRRVRVQSGAWPDAVVELDVSPGAGDFRANGPRLGLGKLRHRRRVRRSPGAFRRVAVLLGALSAVQHADFRLWLAVAGFLHSVTQLSKHVSGYRRRIAYDRLGLVGAPSLTAGLYSLFPAGACVDVELNDQHLKEVLQAWAVAGPADRKMDLRQKSWVFRVASCQQHGSGAALGVNVPMSGWDRVGVVRVIESQQWGALLQ